MRPSSPVTSRRTSRQQLAVMVVATAAVVAVVMPAAAIAAVTTVARRPVAIVVTALAAATAVAVASVRLIARPVLTRQHIRRNLLPVRLTGHPLSNPVLVAIVPRVLVRIAQHRALVRIAARIVRIADLDATLRRVVISQIVASAHLRRVKTAHHHALVMSAALRALVLIALPLIVAIENRVLRGVIVPRRVASLLRQRRTTSQPQPIRHRVVNSLHELIALTVALSALSGRRSRRPFSDLFARHVPSLRTTCVPSAAALTLAPPARLQRPQLMAAIAQRAVRRSRLNTLPVCHPRRVPSSAARLF